MSDKDKNPGVPGAQKKNSYFGRKQKNGKWSVMAPDQTVVRKDLSSTEVTTVLKELNGGA